MGLLLRLKLPYALGSVLQMAAFGSMLVVMDAYPRDNQCEATRGSQWLKSTG